MLRRFRARSLASERADSCCAFVLGVNVDRPRVARPWRLLASASEAL